MKTVWCRYHRGYVPDNDARKIRTGSGRGVVAHICNRCQAIRDLPKPERDKAADKVVREQRQLRHAASKEWKSYKKKIKEISQ